jgi:hypothetical protein
MQGVSEKSFQMMKYYLHRPMDALKAVVLSIDQNACMHMALECIPVRKSSIRGKSEMKVKAQVTVPNEVMDVFLMRFIVAPVSIMNLTFFLFISTSMPTYFIFVSP